MIPFYAGFTAHHSRKKRVDGWRGGMERRITE
jgi:hypothetical protein